MDDAMAVKGSKEATLCFSIKVHNIAKWSTGIENAPVCERVGQC